MLETIPIVKFGDREDEKTRARGRDVELETGTQSVPAHLPAASEADGDKSTGQTDAIIAEAGPELVTTETAEGVGRSAKSEDNSELRTENGLACSVCTDDFVKGQDIRVLPCNHKFHPECIDPWLLNVSGTCPLWSVLPQLPCHEPSSSTESPLIVESIFVLSPPTQNHSRIRDPKAMRIRKICRYRLSQLQPILRLPRSPILTIVGPA